jgi:hypothetical protein
MFTLGPIHTISTCFPHALYTSNAPSTWCPATSTTKLTRHPNIRTWHRNLVTQHSIVYHCTPYISCTWDVWTKHQRYRSKHACMHNITDSTKLSADSFALHSSSSCDWHGPSETFTTLGKWLLYIPDFHMLLRIDFMGLFPGTKLRRSAQETSHTLPLVLVFAQHTHQHQAISNCTATQGNAHNSYTNTNALNIP